MSIPSTGLGQAKKFLRKRQVAQRYSITPRTVERMVDDGRLPPPDFYRGKLPFWGEHTLDKADRAAAAAYRTRKAITETTTA
jgi:hypothetical protein